MRTTRARTASTASTASSARGALGWLRTFDGRGIGSGDDGQLCSFNRRLIFVFCFISSSARDHSETNFNTISSRCLKLVGSDGLHQLNSIERPEVGPDGPVLIFLDATKLLIGYLADHQASIVDRGCIAAVVAIAPARRRRALSTVSNCRRTLGLAISHNMKIKKLGLFFFCESGMFILCV